jgi:hypothetical protein
MKSPQRSLNSRKGVATASSPSAETSPPSEKRSSATSKNTSSSLVPEDTLKSIVSLAELQVRLEGEVVAAEEAFKAKKAALFRVQCLDLPEAMKEAGVSELKLESLGKKIVVTPDLSFSLGKDGERKPLAFAWLEAHDFGGIIKTEVTSSFGKGEIEKAKKLYAQLAKKKLPVTMDRDVHYQTMKAFLKERLSEGVDIPLDIFGINQYDKATIK